MKQFFRKHMSLGVVLVGFVFLIMLASVLIIGAAAFALYHLGFSAPFQGRNPLAPIVVMLLFSILLGTVITAVVSRRMLKPLRKVIEATQRVAAGDFTVRVEGESVPEMEDLTNSFNKMVAELAGIETLRSDFISNVSHEFKTPIVSIRGFAKLLRDPDLPEEARAEYIDIIVSESERLAGLSTNVLELSRLKSTGIVIDKETFLLDEQIRRAVAMMEPRWRQKGLDVELALDEVYITSSPDLLQQVWVNLLDNAIKFTPEGGMIEVTLRRCEEDAVFTISDNGCGMDEDTRAHLFDKFYQGDRSHAQSGNGLGLALAKQIVSLCGGEIEAQGLPGKGSTFTVTLPCG